MTRMCWRQFGKALRRVALAAALVAVVLPMDAMADGSGYRSGYSSHGGYKGHYSHKGRSHVKTPTKTTSGSKGRTYRATYRNGYRNGGGGYSWLNQWGRGSSGNGYTGPNTSVSTPHRSDWNAKLKAQRRWDEQEYKNMQKADSSNVRCGLSNAPAYCYRLKGPYPKEMYVVRY